MEGKQQEYDWLYNPYILKLIHSKAYYVDKLLALYLPNVSRTQHNVMASLMVNHYHVAMLMDDVTLACQLINTQEFTFDIYLLNFEYFHYRLCQHYVEEENDHENAHRREEKGRLFECETLMKGFVQTHKKKALMKRLCQRYTRAIYLNEAVTEEEDDYKNRLSERMRLLLNLKLLVEADYADRIQSRQQIISYDKESVYYLMSLYYVGEFIADYTHLMNNQSTLFLDDGDMTIDTNKVAYIRGDSDVVINASSSSIGNEDTSEEDLQFLNQLWKRLRQALDTHMGGWCILDQPYRSRDEGGGYDEERIEKDEQDQENDENFFVNAGEARLNRMYMGYLNNASKNRTKNIDDYSLAGPYMERRYLPLAGNRNHYEAITYNILFHLRLVTYHTECAFVKGNIIGGGGGGGGGGNSLDCNICNYIYVSHTIPVFNSNCHIHRYNNCRYEKNGRILLDQYLNKVVIRLVKPFDGRVFRMLYMVTLILYNTAIIMKEQKETHFTPCNPADNLFLSLNVFTLINHFNKREIEEDLGFKMAKTLTLCEVVKKEELPDALKEDEMVRHLLFEIELLKSLIINVSQQEIAMEKYGRTLKKRPEAEEGGGGSRQHDRMINHMKKLFLYYVRILYQTRKKLNNAEGDDV